MRKTKPLVLGRVPFGVRVRPAYRRIDDGILALPIPDDQRAEADANMKAFVKCHKESTQVTHN